MPTSEVWRIRDAASFARLRQTGRRARCGPLTVVWLPADPPDSSAPPRVAYAIGRKVGGAVIRNRLRRRLRAAFRSVSPARGTYLVIASPAAASLSSSELTDALAGALSALCPRGERA